MWVDDVSKPVFYAFQVINGLGSLGLFLNPKGTHERMIKNPAKAYQVLGFSDTALEMLHDVLRGQGAALLATSTWLAAIGPNHKASYGLIASTCLFSAAANIFTVMHHRKSSIVMSVIDELTSLYGLIALNVTIGGAALACYLNWPTGLHIEEHITIPGRPVVARTTPAVAGTYAATTGPHV